MKLRRAAQEELAFGIPEEDEPQVVAGLVVVAFQFQ